MTDQGQDPEVRPPASNQPCAEAPALANAYRKVTARLLPLLFACYVISYLDRVNVGFAKLQMDAALGFGDAVYGLGAGIFFVGYFLFEVPSNLILHRVGARRWIARILLTWGMLSAATAFVTTPMQFYTLRFFLGVAEAGDLYNRTPTHCTLIGTRRWMPGKTVENIRAEIEMLAKPFAEAEIGRAHV